MNKEDYNKISTLYNLIKADLVEKINDWICNRNINQIIHRTRF